jgi:hypothetical protein
MSIWQNFIFEEVKMALQWMKRLAIGLAKWIFRWLLRFGMIGAFLLLAGKGCFRVFDRLGSQPNTGSTYPLQNTQGPPLSQWPSPSESAEVPSSISHPVSQRSGTVEVRSAWSTLNYIAGDLTRWVRKR